MAKGWQDRLVALALCLVAAWHIAAYPTDLYGWLRVIVGGCLLSIAINTAAASYKP